MTATQTLAETLEEDFRNPPDAARPFAWWHWMGPYFSKDGITKDLEAMKASGIGGATVFNISSYLLQGPLKESDPWSANTYRGPAYWDALRHAASEADRLGLELGIHNCVGYATTGGPWIDEERSMQRLVWSTVEVDRGGRIEINLPQPDLDPGEGWGITKEKLSFFRDVAVIALLPEEVRRIKSLLQEGATVSVAKPVRSPSLAGYPQCDEEVAALAAQGALCGLHRTGRPQAGA